MHGRWLASQSRPIYPDGADCDDDVDAGDALFVLQHVVGQRPELCVSLGP
jgi:hypothetical protein